MVFISLPEIQTAMITRIYIRIPGLNLLKGIEVLISFLFCTLDFHCVFILHVSLQQKPCVLQDGKMSFSIAQPAGK